MGAKEVEADRARDRVISMYNEKMEEEIDERLWPGAASQGWTVLPRGDIEAARRNCSWTHVSPDGTKHRRRADAVEAHHADVDRRLWVGAAEQGWQVQLHAAPPW